MESNCYTLDWIDNTLSGKETAEEAWFKYFSGWYFIKLIRKNLRIYFLVTQCLSISQTSLLFFYKEHKLGGWRGREMAQQVRGIAAYHGVQTPVPSIYLRQLYLQLQGF